MTREETIRAFCKLMAKVESHLEWQHAADCFCDESTASPEQYRNDGIALAFIRNAVEKALRGES